MASVGECWVVVGVDADEAADAAICILYYVWRSPHADISEHSCCGGCTGVVWVVTG